VYESVNRRTNTVENRGSRWLLEIRGDVPSAEIHQVRRRSGKGRLFRADEHVGQQGNDV